MFERALTYANQLRPSSFWPYGPGIDQVKGDIYLAWGKTEEALTCYERETQRNDFEAVFLGFFRIAKVLLVRNEPEKALRVALEGTAFWLDYPNEMGCGRVLTDSSVSVGEANDHTDACLYFSRDIVKEVCETFLSASQEIAIAEKGRLAYLLYEVYGETGSSNDEHETISKMDDLLLIVEQGSFHPHMGTDLAQVYAKNKDIKRAIQAHLDYCQWKLSALEHHRLKPPASEENQQMLAWEWTFSKYNAEFSCDQKSLESLSEEERESCHAIAWETLQAHIAETDVVTTIFIPFFHSFWSDLLIAGDMHRAVVETARLLVQADTDNHTSWWLLAYHLHELEQIDEAEAAYRRYLELCPDSASALHNLSLILEKKGALQEALALSQKAAALSPDDGITVKNTQRLNTKYEQTQQKQEGATLWSHLSDSQRWLLCLLELYPSAHWSALLPRIKQDEHQVRQIQEDWEWLLAERICVQPEPEHPLHSVPLLGPYIYEESFQYWLAAEIARVQARKKKNLWLPAAVELGDGQLADLSTPQRGLMQQAFMRQIAEVSLSGLEQMYLRFYRRIWKRLLIEWEMYRELTDSYEVFLTRLSSVMTRQEMWECAYYATDLSDSTYQRRAEKWYKAYLEQEEDYAAYHNLSLIYLERKQYQDALQMIEQALRLASEDSESLEQKDCIQRALQEEEEQRQQQELEQQKQQELREQQLKSVEAMIVTHIGDVDFYKQKILRTLKRMRYFSSKKAFARSVDMEDGPLAGHWRKLVAWGMIIENGRQPTVHPLVATYLDQGWPVTQGASMNTIATPTYGTQTAPSGTNDEEHNVPRAIEIIEQLARSFHLVVRKLSQRYDNRTPLEIQDEYDVQDLFHALLTPFFEDIRPEEVAPSHAGGHGRIDFLIKAEQIVIEIKKTRPSLRVKELRDQLIVDKEIYRKHPDCQTFVAFIYDPDGYIDNAIGFERDLSNTSSDMQVKVIVAPR